MAFGLFNVIVAIYVENTVAAAKFNDLRLKQERLLDQQMFAEQVLNLVRIIWLHFKHDEDEEQEEFGADAIRRLRHLQITPETFKDLCTSTDFRDILRTLDIPDEEQLDLFDTLDIDGGGTLDLEELVQGVHKLRGDARRSDIVGVSLQMRQMQEQMGAFQKDLRDLLCRSEDRLLETGGMKSTASIATRLAGKNEVSTASA